MQRHMPRDRAVMNLLLGCLLKLLCVSVHSQQIYVCSPDNLTAPLTCSPGQWAMVTGELYALQLPGGVASSCRLNTTCNEYVHSAGLKTTCNGPVGAVPCREEVHYDDAREKRPCLQGAQDVGAMVQFSCVDGVNVLDLCDTSVQLTSKFVNSQQMVHLASPGFPVSDTGGRLCSCTLEGTRLRVKAVQVEADARLPWHDKSDTQSDDQTVLTIRDAQGVIKWASDECAGCSAVNYANTALVPSIDNVPAMTITYSNFGLDGQNVWLEIREQGPALNITCSARPLPSNRVITTPAPPTTAPPTPPTSAPAPTQARTQPPPPPAPTRPTSDTGGRQKGQEGQGRPSRSQNDDGGGGGDNTVVIILVVLILALIVAAVVLGVIMYRRRGKCQGDGESGLKPMFLAWYRDLACPACLSKQSQDTPDENQGQFHGAATDSNYEVKDTRRGQVQGRHEVEDDELRSAGRVEVIQTEEGEITIVHNDVYMAHSELVGEELARFREQRRQQRALGQSGVHSSNGGDTVPHGASLPHEEAATAASRLYEAIEPHAVKLQSKAKSPPKETSKSPQRASPLAIQEGMADSSTTPNLDSATPQNPSSTNHNKMVNAQDRNEQSRRSTSATKSHSGDKETPDSRSDRPMNGKNSRTGRHSVADSGKSHKGARSDAVSLQGRGEKELLSPEERDMFAALGLTGEDPGNPDPTQHEESGANIGERADALTGSYTETGLKTKERGDEDTAVISKQHHHQKSKVKKSAKPDLVSDILEMSLRDIQGQRLGAELNGVEIGSDGQGAESIQQQQSQC